jgi:hypothetical protein
MSAVTPSAAVTKEGPAASLAAASAATGMLFFHLIGHDCGVARTTT